MAHMLDAFLRELCTHTVPATAGKRQAANTFCTSLQPAQPAPRASIRLPNLPDTTAPLQPFSPSAQWGPRHRLAAGQRHARLALQRVALRQLEAVQPEPLGSDGDSGCVRGEPQKGLGFPFCSCTQNLSASRSWGDLFCVPAKTRTPKWVCRTMVRGILKKSEHSRWKYLGKLERLPKGSSWVSSFLFIPR